MNCLVLTTKTGVSIQFSDLIADGTIELMYKNSGVILKCPFSNTDFIKLSSSLFANRGNIEVKVISENRLVKKKTINCNT